MGQNSRRTGSAIARRESAERQDMAVSGSSEDVASALMVRADGDEFRGNDALFQALLHFIAMFRRSNSAALNKHRSLQAGQKAEQRPAAHFYFGDEGARQNSAVHGNVEIGRMVADEEGRPGV